MSIDFDVIGPYKVIRILGQGGMGTVYHGVHSKTQEPVAIKVIASNMAQHQRFRRRFDAEIQTLLKLKHPNIVQLIGFGEERGLLFYSMEYVDGENLQQQLRREKTISWDRIVDIAIEVCSALKHAHDFGIIHRDLKPANLMITSAGHVKLTDFGIAKLFGALDATVEGAVLGTADYMPPEQAEGKPVSVRSDLYSLGAMCYAGITGRPPFQGKNIPEILFNVRYGNLKPLATVAPNVPKELCDLIDELLRREPSRRPPTGLVVGNRLQALRAGLSKLAQSQAEQSQTDARNLRELTSIDMSDSESLLSDVGSISGNASSLGDATRLDSSASMSVDASAIPDASPRDRSNAPNPSVAGPDERTRVAPPSNMFELSDPPSGIDHMGKTNFTEVQEDDRRRSTIMIPQDDTMSPWVQWTSVGGLIGLLLACVIGIYWFSLAPSANRLYRELAPAIETANEEEMMAAESVAERFASLYPNDPRIEDVQALLAEIDAARSIRQLQRRAKRSGSDQLDAIEQAFLECIKAQSVDSGLAQRKLDALIAVFAAEDKLTKKQRQLLELAKRMAADLSAMPKPAKNPALESLQEQMIWVEANLSPKAQSDWLRNVVELFEDKEWAKDLIGSAKSKLAALDRADDKP